MSLTSLDQTDKQYFNPNNAFEAEGLTRLTEQTEARRKQRNDVEQDTEVQVRTKKLDASRQKLTINVNGIGSCGPPAADTPAGSHIGGPVVQLRRWRTFHRCAQRRLR